MKDQTIVIEDASFKQGMITSMSTMIRAEVLYDPSTGSLTVTLDGESIESTLNEMHRGL